MKRSEIVEAIYGAIIKEGQRWNQLTGKEIRTGPPLDYLLAEAALDALTALGLTIVPVVATEEMIQAAADAWHNAKDDPALCPLGPGESAEFFYAAMLTAQQKDS